MNWRGIFVAALVWATWASAQQLTTPISALPSATTPLTGTEVGPIVQSGTTVKVPLTPWNIGATATTVVNVRDTPYGGKADAISFNDGNILSGSSIFQAPSSFALSSSCVPSKVLIIDGAGPGGVPLKTSCSMWLSAGTIVTADQAQATPSAQAINAAVSTRQSGVGSYAPGDAITLACTSPCAATTSAILGVDSTGVTAAVQNNNGSGGTPSNGSCTVFGTTGNGDYLFSAKVHLTGGSIDSVTAILKPGNYITNPSNLAAEPVTGCGNLVNATLGVTMGVNYADIANHGAYQTIPCTGGATNCVVAQASTTGSGTGATFNVTFSKGTVWYYGTDNTSAINSAIAAVNNLETFGFGATLYFPGGFYLTQPGLTQLKNSASVVGDGNEHSWIILDPTVGGDLFSWNDAWAFGFYPANGQLAPSTSKLGPIVKGITVSGDMGALSQQNVLMFYGRTDHALIEDFTCNYVQGYGFSTGLLFGGDTQAFMRESTFIHTRFRNCGKSGAPTVYFGSVGSGDATNVIHSFDMQIVFPGCIGLKIDNQNTTVGTRQYYFEATQIHGIQAPAAPIPCDLMVIGAPLGDTTYVGKTSDVHFTGLHINASYTGQYSLTVQCSDISSQPYTMSFEGAITSGRNGVNIACGRNMDIKFPTVSTKGPCLTVGAAPNVGVDIVWDQIGSIQSNCTFSIDPTSINNVLAYQYVTGQPSINQISTFTGHLVSQGTAPTLDTATCDADSSFTGIPTDTRGKFNTGTTGTSSCKVNWGETHASKPFCTCYNGNASATARCAYNYGSSTLTVGEFDFSASVTSAGFIYQCIE